VQILPLDPDPAPDDVAGVHRVISAATAVDRPGDPLPVLEQVDGRLHSRPPGRRLLRWVARGDGGDIVGYGMLRLPDLDNVHLGLVELTVHPDARRHGAGRALARVAVDAIAADGRRLVLMESYAGTDGEHFCQDLGMRLVQTARMSLLPLADVDWADVEGPPPRRTPATGWSAGWTVARTSCWRRSRRRRAR